MSILVFGYAIFIFKKNYPDPAKKYQGSALDKEKVHSPAISRHVDTFWACIRRQLSFYLNRVERIVRPPCVCVCTPGGGGFHCLLLAGCDLVRGLSLSLPSS